MKWKNVFANYVSDKGLISKIYKYTYSPTAKNQIIQSKNGQKNFNRHFSKEDMKANKHMKRCSTSLVIREMQIKTTVRYLAIT